MTTSTARARRVPEKPLKSPLAVASFSAPADITAAPDLPGPGHSALSDREATLAEFDAYLRTMNNRDGRPFEEKTILAYCDPAKNLDRWMAAQRRETGFPGGTGSRAAPGPPSSASGGAAAPLHYGELVAQDQDPRGFHASSHRDSRNPVITLMTRREMNRRHMISDHHGRVTGIATSLLTATDGIIGTHRFS